MSTPPRMTAGIVGTSRKENERRLPIHPGHFERLSASCRPALRFEEGYGAAFGVDRERLLAFSGGVLPRRRLLAECDLVILPKPLAEDLGELAEGATLWGWPHCVQQSAVTQAAIDRRLTLIAFEAMFRWTAAGRRGTHLFQRNNELAGYCAILHALELAGRDGFYGRRGSAVLLGFGSVSRGAAYALAGRGFDELTILTQRPPHLVRNRLLGARFLQMRRAGDGVAYLTPEGERRPLVELLAGAELIVNGTLQNTERPLMFLGPGEEERLAAGCWIVDVSCDEAMGFPFARPTSFAEPTFAAGPATYYGVDHTPSYLWDAASWEISDALLPYLERVLAGPEAWAEEPVLERAVEIRDGVVVNPEILRFQGREKEHPHRVSSRL